MSGIAFLRVPLPVRLTTAASHSMAEKPIRTGALVAMESHEEGPSYGLIVSAEGWLVWTRTEHIRITGPGVFTADAVLAVAARAAEDAEAGGTLVALPPASGEEPEVLCKNSEHPSAPHRRYPLDHAGGPCYEPRRYLRPMEEALGLGHHDRESAGERRFGPDRGEGEE